MRPHLLRTLLLCLLTPALALAQDLRFTTLDIGQGDSAVLMAPGGCVALFDGGPTGSGATIKAYLRSLGVTRVDMAFISHFHEDHLGGMDEVAQGTDAIPISAVYDHGGTYASTAFNEYNAQYSGVRHTVTAGQTFSLCGQVTLKVVAVATGYSDENSNSVVVKISYGAFDAVVGGDLTGTNINNTTDVESSVGPKVGDVELYKVHHHGSRYSSNDTFLSATNPLVSFISVGVGNTYGHPTAECLSRLSAHGSDIWQTEDPSTNTKRGHIQLRTTTGDTFTVAQGSSSVLYTSKGAVADAQAPTAPGSLVATAASSSEVDLSWNASTDNVGVTGYRVYRSTSGGAYALAGTSTTTGFADTGLSASTSYAYYVTAVDAAGNASAASNTASVTTPAATSAAKVIINEILANEPGSSTAGEFIELVNVGGTSIDLSKWTLSDATSVRHTFASGTTLAAGKALVVYGGASAIPSGMSNAVAASTGALSLNNTSDTVTLKNAQAGTVDSYAYASSLASVDGVSMNRSPDATAGAGFVLHTSVSSLSSSPGKRANGTAF